jgi:hypothetical protein
MTGDNPGGTMRARASSLFPPLLLVSGLALSCGSLGRPSHPDASQAPSFHRVPDGRVPSGDAGAAIDRASNAEVADADAPIAAPVDLGSRSPDASDDPAAPLDSSAEAGDGPAPECPDAALGSDDAALPTDGPTPAQDGSSEARDATTEASGDRMPPIPIDGSLPPRARAILVSVDGLGAYYLRQQLERGQLPGFAALGRAGASTLNARADCDYTVTLPNHVSMVTGRPVAADPALPDTTFHGFTANGVASPEVTLHNSGNPNLSYIASVFDVAHDHGLATCLYAGKPKFSLFSSSYNGKNGAPDTVGQDNGRNKIDRVMILDLSTETMLTTAEGDLAAGSCDFAFIHIADMDSMGHGSGWGSDAWLATLNMVDGWIGRLLAFADGRRTAPPFALVVTADHGGAGYDHSDPTSPYDYTIPFYVVGPGIPSNANLYALTGPGRGDPGVLRPRYSVPRQPVRNADAADVLTHVLGLPPVPGAFMRDLLP